MRPARAAGYNLRYRSDPSTDVSKTRPELPPVDANATQRIIKIRRDYNSWVADETLDD